MSVDDTTLDALVKKLDGLHAKLPKGDFAFVPAIRDAWPRIRTALSSTQARADKLEAELVEAKRERDEAMAEAGHYCKLACDDPGKNPPIFWKDRAESAESSLAQANERVAAAESRAAAMREALVAFVKSADANEGGMFPDDYRDEVEAARIALEDEAPSSHVPRS